MTEEEQELLNDYQQEVEKCFNIAQKLDAFNPELAGAFTGTPSIHFGAYITTFPTFIITHFETFCVD